jgi:hypothetical protein
MKHLFFPVHLRPWAFALALFIATTLPCIGQNALAQTDARILAQPLVEAYLQQERAKKAIAPDDLKEWTLSDAYTDRRTGITHAYVQQTFNGIPVFNAISTVAIKDGRVGHFVPHFVKGLEGKAQGTVLTLNAQDAVFAALKHLEKPAPQQITPLTDPKAKDRFRFSVPEIAASPVVAALVYVSWKDSVRSAWNVSIEMKGEPHWWNVRVDAATGAYIDKNDYTVSCGFDPTEGGSHGHTGLSESTHACQEASAVMPMPLSPTSTYNVFPLPIEAPTFGTRSLESDPEDITASPFGWHDDNGVAGAEYTITRGNNVYAYDDADNDNTLGYSPDGGPGLEFDFAFDPLDAPMNNMDAALTNLFYHTNVVHDILHGLGFDENAGNFQANNYGNGGEDSDHVLAEGFDGSGTNNANFSTPPDGQLPRMQMYLWNSVPDNCEELNITSGLFNGAMEVGHADFTSFGTVTAALILANDGVGNTSDVCSDIMNDVTGKIVLLDRGGCTFILKAQRAEAAGAVGIIIANNQTTGANNMTGSPAVTIPVVSVSQADGVTLKAALLDGAVQANIVTCATEPFDSNFDNGIIAHEIGHGVSNRLTGGPSQSSCLANEEQGGEGWSDWLAMMMTINPGDDGADARGVGSYVNNQASSGGGIRRFPYSTDMGINPQTYGDLATSVGPHARGEIWCASIWDMSWLLMDAFGFNSDLSDQNAGNHIAIRLVLEGMKLQPCEPGYLDARDGILAADDMLYGGAHQALIWEAFARRGMGCGADQGSSDVVGDEAENFDEPNIYYQDADTDGFGDPDEIAVACSQPIGYVANSDDCDDTDILIGTGCLQWTGAVSTDWNTVGNWDPAQVPTSSDHVVIHSAPANQPQVNQAPGSPATTADLNIATNASVTVNAGKALTVTGDLTNRGSLLVKADATGIGSLITQGVVAGAGSFTMEQYLTGAGGAVPNGRFFYVSSPLSAATSAVFDAAGTNKLWSANEPTQLYTEITDNATALHVGQGYVARMGATGTRTFDGGVFNTGNVDITGLTRTGVAAPSRGFNLVGNPYPSTVNWNTASKTNLTTSIWFRTNDGSAMKVDTYNTTGNIGTNNNGNGAVTNMIPPTQAFWVRVDADGNTGSLLFDNADRGHQAWTSIYKQAEEEGTVRLTLSNAGSEASDSDETIILFNAEAQDGFDDFDSHKMWGSASVPQLYTTVDADSLVINGLFSIETNPIVDLGVKLPVDGNYTIAANSITLGEEVWLEDRVLNNFQHLNQEPVYAFTSEAGNIGSRFALHFGAMVTGIGRDVACNVCTQVFAADNTVHVILGGDNAKGNASILDMTGRIVQTAALNGNRTAIATELCMGIYLVRIETAKGLATHRVFLK